MNVKFIIAPVLAIAAIAVLVLNQGKSSDDSFESSVIKPSSELEPANDSLKLGTNNFAEPVEIQKKAVSKEREQNTSGNNRAHKADDLEERYRLLSTNENYPTLASRINAIKERRPNLDISPEAILTALARSDSWEAVQDPPARVKSKLTEEQVHDGRRFVKFDTTKVETLMPGDNLYIAIDDLGAAYDMKVEEVEDFNDGNLMWKGAFVNAEGTAAEGGKVTITQSSNITVAAVIFREKDYILESYGTDGWIANSASLFDFNADRSDAVIPPGEERTDLQGQ